MPSSLKSFDSKASNDTTQPGQFVNHRVPTNGVYNRSGVNSTKRALLRDGTTKSRLPWLDGRASSVPESKSALPPTPLPGGFISSSERSPSSKSSASPKANMKRSTKFLNSNSKAPLVPKRPLRRLRAPKSPTNTATLSHPKPESPTVSETQTTIAAADSTAGRIISSPEPASNSFTNAISAFEDLMQDAVNVARDAAETGDADSAAKVFNGATIALQEAGTVNESHKMAVEQAFPPPEMAYSFSSDSSGSFDEDDIFFSDTASTRSTSPILGRTSVYRVFQVEPKTESASLQGSVTRTDPNSDLGQSRNSSSCRSISATPPQLYSLNRKTTTSPVEHPVSRDFAYSQPTAGFVSLSSSTEGSWAGQEATRPYTHQPNTRLQVDSSPEGVSPGSLGDVRPRMRSVAEITPQPWVPPRHNTAIVGLDKGNGNRSGVRAHARVNFDPEYTRRLKYRKRRHAPGESKQYRESLADKPEGTSSRRERRGIRGYRSHRPHLGRHVRRHPIARSWETTRKRITATIACINTGIVSFIIGIYAGMVPRIQYVLADQNHYIIQGNIYLFIGLAISTFFTWPLPLLHGRKPYTLAAFAIALPLHFPQAVIVSTYRSPDKAMYHVGILIARFFTGLTLGFANVNFFTVLLDLFGASLMSSHPHQEIVMNNDARRDGGGMGIWLGIWSWCFIASLAIGFVSGAGVINRLNPEWGFYVTIILIAFVLVLNVMAPETRRSGYRRSYRVYVGEDEKMRHKVARGEIKLHVSDEGPLMWYHEVGAGIRLSFRMLFQRGFFVLSLYLGWIYAQVVLVIILLGALLSREYSMRPKYIGLGVFAIAVGALLAVPLSKAGLFSRDRKQGPRTDSMTFEKQVTWSSHLVRRVVFMLALPIAGIAYTLVSGMHLRLHFMAPIMFAGLIGFLSNLAIAECRGLIMETFDTCDLQPGVNSRHRLQSMAENVRRRRTSYSSFPRVTAGLFVSEAIGFFLAAAATGVGGIMTRSLGAQVSTGVTAGILLFLTLMLTMALWRFKSVRVIPGDPFTSSITTAPWSREKVDEYWQPVIIGNPSGKVRRMSLLELGRQSRWTEIRRLNKLIRD